MLIIYNILNYNHDNCTTVSVVNKFYKYRTLSNNDGVLVSSVVVVIGQCILFNIQTWQKEKRLKFTVYGMEIRNN